jgi:O-methyltransferase involved in polyketide biosynthesis
VRWFDVDGPTIIERKRDVLDGASPRCSWHPLVADLADAESRREALRTATSGANRALVVTEGLLLYLQPDQVAALAADLAAHAACTAWVTDLLSAEGVVRAAAIYKKPFAQSGIAVRFGPEDGPAFFARLGFTEVESQSTTLEACRLERLPRLYTWVLALMQRLSARNRDRLYQSSRVVRLERTRTP